MHKLLLKKMSALFVILILSSLIIFNAFNFYKLFTNKAVEPARQNNSVVSTNFKSKKVPPPNVISRWHLMGENKSNKPLKAPKTTLNLKLIGILSSSIDGQARAIIEISPRKHQFFKVGDDIKQNVKVKFINADHIIINHNSREEIVPLISLKPKTPILKKVVAK